MDIHLIKPFEDNEVLSFGDLIIKNGINRVTIYGGITKDKAGLEAALKLYANLESILLMLELEIEKE